jgi:hypothetical protein
MLDVLPEADRDAGSVSQGNGLSMGLERVIYGVRELGRWSDEFSKERRLSGVHGEATNIDG